MSSQSSHIGSFPFMGCIGKLNCQVGSFLEGNSSAEELQEVAADLRASNWRQMAGIKYIPSNTFSYHNPVLDTTTMLGAVPPRYDWKGGEIGFDTYFSMARGNGSVPAMEMASWPDTDYHYTVPELGPDVKFSYASHKAVDEFKEAKALGVDTVPVLVGPVSYLLLSKPAEGVENSFSILSLIGKILPVYNEVVAELKAAGALWIQFDELVTDLDSQQLHALTHAYSELESSLSGLSILIQTYFADMPAETYKTLTTLKGVAGFGFDLVCGKRTLGLVKGGFPSGKYLFAGVVDGRNIRANNVDSSLKTLQALEGVVGKDKIVVSTSCPLLHTDVDLVSETRSDREIESWPAFAAQKVLEVAQALFRQKDEVPGVSMRDSFPVEGVAFKKTFSYEVCKQKPHKKTLFNITEPAPVAARPSIEDVQAAEILMSFKENQVYPTPASEATVLPEVQMEVFESETRPYPEIVSDLPSERAKGVEEEARRLKGREKVIEEEGEEENGKEKSMEILHELKKEHNGVGGSAMRGEGKKGDDDERIYADFTPTSKISEDSNFGSPSFLSAVHAAAYNSLQKRGVMQPRYVNFSYFKDNGFSASDLLEKYKSVCQLSEEVYSQAIALFYSGLSFPSPDEFVCQFSGQQFTLKVGELASMLSLSCSIFKKIPVRDTQAYKAITLDPSFERKRGSHVYQAMLPLDMKILQKVLILCLRPKAASTNDISKYEGRLLWAIKNNIEFSLPHTIFLHMHRTIRKSSGKLPYGGLIMMILREKHITIPDEFKTGRIQTLEFGAESWVKMKRRETDAGVIDVRGECSKVADDDENAVMTPLENTMRGTEGDLNRKRKQKGYAERDGPTTCQIMSAVDELMLQVAEIKDSVIEIKAILKAPPHHLYQVDKAVSLFNPVEPCVDPNQTSRSTSLSQQKRQRK